MAHLQAAIFDMDGLLIDSEPFWQRAQMKVLGKLGLNLTTEDTEQTMGVRIDEVVRFWYERRPWSGPQPDEVAEMIVDEVIRLVHSEGERMKGVDEALELFRSLGVPIGLATSSSDRLIEAVLSALILEHVFRITTSAAHEEFGKPHPDVYLSAARKLGVEPGGCLVFEDSVYGVQAGKAAGMKVVAVPAPHQYDLPGFDEADLKLRSLAELSEYTIADLFG